MIIEIQNGQIIKDVIGFMSKHTNDLYLLFEKEELVISCLTFDTTQYIEFVIKKSVIIKNDFEEGTRLFVSMKSVEKMKLNKDSKLVIKHEKGSGIVNILCVGNKIIEYNCRMIEKEDFNTDSYRERIHKYDERLKIISSVEVIYDSVTSLIGSEDESILLTCENGKLIISDKNETGDCGRVTINKSERTIINYDGKEPIVGVFSMGIVKGALEKINKLFNKAEFSYFTEYPMRIRVKTDAFDFVQIIAPRVDDSKTEENTYEEKKPKEKKEGNQYKYN